MEVYRISCRPFLFLGILCLAATLQAVQGGVESEGPSESECRPYIEKALRQLETTEAAEQKAAPDESEEQPSEEAENSTVEVTVDDSDHEQSDGDDEDEAEVDKESVEGASTEVEDKSQEVTDSKETEQEDDASEEQKAEEDVKVDDEQAESAESEETQEEEQVEVQETEGVETEETETEGADEAGESEEETQAEGENEEEHSQEIEDEPNQDDTEEQQDKESEDEQSSEIEASHEEAKSEETQSEEETKSEEAQSEEETQSEEANSVEEANEEDETKSAEVESKEEESIENEGEEKDKASQESAEADVVDTIVTQQETSAEASDESAEQIEEQQNTESAEVEDHSETSPDANEVSTEEKEESSENEQSDAVAEAGEATSDEDDGSRVRRDVQAAEDETENESQETEEVIEEDRAAIKDVPETVESHAVTETTESQEEMSEKEALEETAGDENEDEVKQEEGDEVKETLPEEELVYEDEIPDNLRPTDHIRQLLKLDDENTQSEKILNSIAEITLRDLKRLYESAIKPLETLYKYRDLSNRHYGDAEIFSKPLVLFMGPWSGGKSSIINYLIENEYSENSLRTGAEPSPAYFNILMYGEEAEVLDGTQMAADFTFSGLQKFGQGLEERLRGTKLPQKLLQKINIVEIPGILEVRKQISRVFPFNDACQWFIDRADIIYLTYDPSKLDVGPETEAILDQLKGREHQTRIILNKADQVKPEELMRVQSALIWNISPLMSSAQPPAMYTTSLWSRPYETGAPIRLLQAQERAFLRDLRTAIDKRIENKIASARRFAVRVRNHAKMVDCYLTTYYNHKSVFGNRKQVSDTIIEHPQDYHIYEGLSTLTNISRYDLPDPDVYRDFFRLNPLYDFQQLSATCTYFRGCPINRLDVAIAYDLPELVGKHKRMVEATLAEAGLSRTPGS